MRYVSGWKARASSTCSSSSSSRGCSPSRCHVSSSIISILRPGIGPPLVSLHDCSKVAEIDEIYYSGVKYGMFQNRSGRRSLPMVRINTLSTSAAASTINRCSGRGAPFGPFPSTHRKFPMDLLLFFILLESW